jgi:hypothetical protein
MRVAALYDIHGNLPALEAVLEQIHAEPATHNLLNPRSEEQALELFGKVELQ